MPYTGADDPHLPHAVRKMSEKARERFAEAFNHKYYTTASDESEAFRAGYRAVREVDAIPIASEPPAEPLED